MIENEPYLCETFSNFEFTVIKVKTNNERNQIHSKKYLVREIDVNCNLLPKL